MVPGIVHLGIGAIFRAHGAIYLDGLLERDPRWGIVGVSLRRGVGLYTKTGFYEEIQQGTLCFVPLIHDVLLNLRIGVIMSASSAISPPERLLGNEIGRALAQLRLDS